MWSKSRVILLAATLSAFLAGASDSTASAASADDGERDRLLVIVIDG